ncbi:MAG: hydrogenase maturation protease [Phycisphaerales bacterium]|nr:hydrogenase maturation protease [Phycisphaerales bacterium]
MTAQRLLADLAGEAALTAMRRTAKVVGCGRWNRGDDQFGLLVVQRLMQDAHGDVDITTSESPGADLLSLIEGIDLLVLVDAAVASAALPVGALRRIRLNDRAVMTGAVCRFATRVSSAHSLGVGYALALADSLGIQPQEIWIYVVGSHDFSLGAAMSQSVAVQIEPTARRIRKDLQRAMRRGAPEAFSHSAGTGAGHA